MEARRVCGKRILVADDEPDVRNAIRMLLSLDKHEVIEAADGAEALDLFTRCRFDLVITDYSMPRMKGNELAVRIKQLAPTQPLLMITAYGQELRGTANPVDTILSKPFQFEDLRQAIASLLT